MNLITRNRCVISDREDLELLYRFNRFPVFMGCVRQPPTADMCAEMSWWISRGTGIIQLNQVLPMDVLYPESHGAGSVGCLWDKHHKALARFLSTLTPSSVFEVGGAHGILAKEYQEFSTIPWTILEPNPSPVKGTKARFIKGFFNKEFSYMEPFEVLVHSHVFEHIYEPDQFMSHLAEFIKEGKHLVFSLPNMQVMLERRYNNCLNFEHTVFLIEPYIEFLLAKHGFRLMTKEYFMDDHSIFYAAVRDLYVKPTALLHNLYEKNRQLYMDYIHYHEELVQDLNKKIEALTQPIFLFGAHIFAQYLVAFGLDTTRIVSLLDNDPNKQGKRLCGTDLMVQSPKVLIGMESPAVILRAGVYNHEIKADILGNINPSTIFF